MTQTVKLISLHAEKFYKKRRKRKMTSLEISHSSPSSGEKYSVHNVTAPLGNHRASSQLGDNLYVT